MKAFFSLLFLGCCAQCASPSPPQPLTPLEELSMEAPDESFFAEAPAPEQQKLSELPDPPSKRRQVTVQGLRVRRHPSQKASVLAFLAQGEHVLILENKETWVKIQRENSKTPDGWVCSNFLRAL